MKILVYGFSHKQRPNPSSEVAQQLGFPFHIIDGSTNEKGLEDTRHLLCKIRTGKFSHIIGFGTSSNCKKLLRIETRCTNKFRNDKIAPDGPEAFEISNFLPQVETSVIQISSKMGNSWCNMTAYRISQLISRQSLHSQLAFLHIPTHPSIPSTISSIFTLLSDSILSHKE